MKSFEGVTANNGMFSKDGARGTGLLNVRLIISVRGSFRRIVAGKRP